MLLEVGGKRTVKVNWESGGRTRNFPGLGMIGTFLMWFSKSCGRTSDLLKTTSVASKVENSATMDRDFQSVGTLTRWNCFV